MKVLIICFIFSFCLTGLDARRRLCPKRRPDIPHARYIDSRRLSRIRRKISSVLKYRCNEGYTRVGGAVTCGRNLRWTTFKCVVQCFKDYNSTKVDRLGLSCGTRCNTSADCQRTEFCKCDGPCSRRCVNKSINCGEAPMVANANVSINGLIARYRCHEGYYLASGKLSMHCLGSGNIWDNSTKPECELVICGSPNVSIYETQGMISGERGPYYYGAVVNFSCPINYKLYGSPTRNCTNNGQWSGELAACDLSDHNLERCPHPGRPINGQIIGSNFSVGAIVRFECDEGYIMYGDGEQECLYFLEWSGSRTPRCVDYRYPNTASNRIGSLTRSLQNLPDVRKGLGQSIDGNDIDERHEIYFVFDISKTVLDDIDQLKDATKFAIRLVRRLESLKSVHYCIILFASDYLLLRNIRPTDNSEDQTDEVIGELENIPHQTFSNTEKTRFGRRTSKALEVIHAQIGLNNETDPERKIHVFMFISGMHNEGEIPDRNAIESTYKNTEIYCITTCNKALATKELLDLSSGEDHFIKIEDFYLLPQYLDDVTTEDKDYSECGKNGNQESVKKHASEIGTKKGENAEEDDWRWQVLIATKGSTIVNTLANINGGGSIINEHWILTAAHVLKNHIFDDWINNTVVFVGIVDLPRRQLKKSVKVYEIKDYKKHPNFNSFNRSDLNNDIALIQVGARLHDDMTTKYEGEGLTFGYYVRPVCLPCTGTCVTNENLVGDYAVNDAMNFEEKCKKEEKFLLQRDKEIVVTGFGHSEWAQRRDYTVTPARRLQMSHLKISGSKGCRKGINAIREETKDEVRYTNNMICCKPRNGNKPYSACKGDSGGALVRRVKHRVGEGSRDRDEYCWVAIGIVSFGIGCARGDNIPGYYTNVAKYIQWINEATGGMLYERKHLYRHA